MLVILFAKEEDLDDMSWDVVAFDVNDTVKRSELLDLFGEIKDVVEVLEDKRDDIILSDDELGKENDIG